MRDTPISHEIEALAWHRERVERRLAKGKWRMPVCRSADRFVDRPVRKRVTIVQMLLKVEIAFEHMAARDKPPRDPVQ